MFCRFREYIAYRICPKCYYRLILTYVSDTVLTYPCRRSLDTSSPIHPCSSLSCLQSDSLLLQNIQEYIDINIFKDSAYNVAHLV